MFSECYCYRYLDLVNYIRFILKKVSSLSVFRLRTIVLFVKLFVTDIICLCICKHRRKIQLGETFLSSVQFLCLSLIRLLMPLLHCKRGGNSFVLHTLLYCVCGFGCIHHLVLFLNCLMPLLFVLLMFCIPIRMVRFLGFPFASFTTARILYTRYAFPTAIFCAIHRRFSFLLPDLCLDERLSEVS